jgi:hypothetical protein
MNDSKSENVAPTVLAKIKDEILDKEINDEYNRLKKGSWKGGETTLILVSEKIRRSSNKSFKATLCIAKLALIVSFLALLVTIINLLFIY